jgi:hypothetical protein
LIGIQPEFKIARIVEQMEHDRRSQAFFMISSLRVYTIEASVSGISYRVWHTIDSNQIIIFDKLVHVEYTPTEDDILTDDDYEFSRWFCFGKQLINRHEYALQCLASQQPVCYIPCSSMDEINLIPVGQHGSTNVNKLQTIDNLLERFPMPIDIKVAQLLGAFDSNHQSVYSIISFFLIILGSHAYKDFRGSVRLFGSRTEEFAVCGSLSSTNIVAIPTNTLLKFIVAPLTQSTEHIDHVLSKCHTFKHSFMMEIRRILILTDPTISSSRRSRARYPKIQEAIDKQIRHYKRSYSVDSTNYRDDEQTTTTDDGYRSGSTASQRRNAYDKSRAVHLVSSAHSIEYFYQWICADY